MADRSTSIPGNQIEDDSIKQDELDITNTPTDGQMIKINMPTGDFTAIDIGNISDITVMQTNIVLNAFRIAINGSLTQFNMVDGIVDEYEDENSVDNPNSTNEEYDSVNDLYNPLSSAGLSTSPFTHIKCNDNTGSPTVTDNGTGANSATAKSSGSNTNTTNFNFSPGIINDAFELNASGTPANDAGENIEIDALATDIASDNTGSFAFWIYSYNITDDAWICTFRNTTNLQTLTIHGGDLLRLQIIGLANDFTVDMPANTLVVNTWTHVVWVQNGTSAKAYINGSEVTVTETDISLGAGSWFNDITSAVNCRIGSEKTPTNERKYFEGRLDDFRYYQNKALTLDEVQAIYNYGPFTAQDVPTNARIVLFEEDVDSVTLNTDLKAFVTRDAGQTFTTDFATDDKLDITSHGFSNTDRIMVTSSSQDLPSGLDPATVYYVVNATTNDFELSLTSGGSAVDITDNGTGTHTAKQVTESTLSNDGEYESGKNVLTGSIDISGQPSGTSMEYYLVTANNKDLKIHGTGLSWD